MKKANKIPRILKIKSIEGYNISCIFNNGETRDIDFKVLFRKWKVKKNDIEAVLLDPKKFRKVGLRNNTLSWNFLRIPLIDLKGKEVFQPFEIDPVVLFENSVSNKQAFKSFELGSIIKRNRLAKGLSQNELASRSGTSKTYISRIENNQIEPELHTLHKIVELGLGKKIEVRIY